MGHLGPGGGGEVGAVQLTAENSLGLQIAQIGHVGGLSLCGVAGGAGLRAAGAVEAADAPGENDDLPHRHGVLKTEGPVGLAHRQSILIQGHHVVVKYRALAQIGKFSGIGLAAGEVAGGVRRGQGGDGQQQTHGQQHGGDPLFHVAPPW